MLGDLKTNILNLCLYNTFEYLYILNVFFFKLLLWNLEFNISPKEKSCWTFQKSYIESTTKDINMYITTKIDELKTNLATILQK